MSMVSVVIPAYNAEEYLDEAIESVLNQTFQDFEVIVIDDCSTDNTWPIIRNFANKDSRVRAYLNTQNLGIAGNRNKGISLATGKYLAWQDADDISLPIRLEKQYKFMESHPEVGIVGGYIELFRGQKTVGIRKYPTDDISLRGCIFRYSPIAQPAAMLRLEALRKVGQYNPKYLAAEDLDMTFRIGEYFKLANLDEIVLRYRESDTSATFTHLKKMELGTLEIRRKYASSSAYKIVLGDRIYNLLHFMSVWIVPSRVKIRLFNWWRNMASQ